MKAFPCKSNGARAGALLGMALLSLAFAQRLDSYPLRRATLEAFGNYVLKTDAQNSQTLRQGLFLWIDDLKGKDRVEALARLEAGDVETRRLSVNASGGNLEVPGGMIHDWEGMVFIPGARLDDVLGVLQDYDHQATFYAPDVEKSWIESRNGDEYKVFLRFRREKVVTVVLDTEHVVNYYRDGPSKAHSRSSAVRIAQVENAGGADEREKQAGDDDGYLWGMETWWRLEQRDGGVYVQNEVVTLTRDIPTGLGWLIEPFIVDIPKETLRFTLQATRTAVLNRLGASLCAGDRVVTEQRWARVPEQSVGDEANPGA